MPKLKLKSHSGAKKRFFKTASGKFAYRKSSRAHILVNKKPSRMRRLKNTGYVTAALTEQMRHLLPYD